MIEIQFTKRPLGEIADKVDDKEFFGKLLKKFVRERKLEKCAFLSADDAVFLEEYFSYLGKSDVAGQSGYFNSVSQKLNERAELAAKEATKYTDLYIKLGFLLGLAVLILMV